MKKYIPMMALAAACLMALAACGSKKPAASSEGPASSSLPVQQPDTSAGVPVSEALSMSDARRLLA